MVREMAVTCPTDCAHPSSSPDVWYKLNIRSDLRVPARGVALRVAPSTRVQTLCHCEGSATPADLLASQSSFKVCPAHPVSPGVGLKLNLGHEIA